jgi:hypothetical protein
MRYLLVGVIVVLAACGDSDSTAPPPPPANGQLVFELDANTCSMYATDPVNVILSVGQAPVDTLDMIAGDTASFEETSGLHLVGAQETGAKTATFIPRKWANTLVTVPEGGSYTWLMTCD